MGLRCKHIYWWRRAHVLSLRMNYRHRVVHHRVQSVLLGLRYERRYLGDRAEHRLGWLRLGRSGVLGVG